MPERGGHIPSALFIPCGMDWHAVLPCAAAFSQEDLMRAREIRLRPGQPLWALLPEGEKEAGAPLAPADVLQAARALSAHSLAARQRELAAGYLPLPGGHRLGVCGVMGREGLEEITSLCLRLAHEIKGVGETVFPRIKGRHALILGPPGAGKTTLLRDLIRLYGGAGAQVGVADERGEIAGCRQGAPQLDVGKGADVVSGMPKARAIMLLVRAMGPQVIATDELDGAHDCAAVRQAMGCGVTVLATAHARSRQEAVGRLGSLARAFDLLVILEAAGKPPRVVSRGNEEDRACDGCWP